MLLSIIAAEISTLNYKHDLHIAAFGKFNFMIQNKNIDANSLAKVAVAVYFHSTSDSINTVAQINLNDSSWELQLCTSWDELSTTIKSKPDMICFHISMVTSAGLSISEFSNMIETFMRLSNTNRNIPLCIAIEKSTTTKIIKELQKTPVVGIVPCSTDFGVEEARKAIDAIINRIPYWPKYILDQLPGVPKTIKKNSITLTPRQSEIADLITSRGLSNKRIANTLNITESTVKIHVSAILKAYGVRTRTQLVVVGNK